LPVAYNPYIIVPFATWAVAQIAKFAIAAFRGKIDFRYLYASGGMPSVHSAVVCSLAMTALLVDGYASHLFGFTLIFAAVVMYDSFGVRRSAGEQAAAINMLIGSLGRNKVRLDNPSLHLREILGHQPREVTAGAILGVVLAMLFSYDHLGALGTFIQTVPPRPEMLAYLAIFLVLIIGGAVARFVLRARYRKSKSMKAVAASIFVATQTIGWLGLFTVAMVYERASYFAWRLWPLAVLLAGLLWALWLLTSNYRTIPEKLQAEAEQARKDKWLKKK
jgi:acid phosphatase family membrane protein YuiD